MIIRFFTAGSRSGEPYYLVALRADRAAWVIGDPDSFALLVSLMATDNPFCAFVISFETTIDDETALRIAQEFVDNVLLGGAARGIIPYILVLHNEPFRAGHRTAVHGSVANIHLGLGRTIRPYHAPHDNWWRYRWQSLANEELGTRKPQWTKAKLRKAPLPAEPVAREVIVAVREVLIEELASRPDTATAIIAANEIIRAGLPELNGGGATIHYDDDKLTLSYLKRKWPLGQIVRPGGRTAHRSDRATTRGVNTPLPDLGALAKARSAHFIREFGAGWHAPAPAAVAARDAVYAPRKLRPSPLPDQGPATTIPAPRRNEIEYGSI